jgi:flagellar biosynthesis/type III secretory pathway chaperone
MVAMIDSICLQQILAGEVEALEELLKIEEKMENILIKGDAKALHGINMQKEELIKIINEAEKQRRGAYTSSLTLKEYISKEKPPAAEELERIRKRLLQLQASLQRQQKINRHLLRHNLRFLEYVLEGLFPQKGVPRYLSSGEVKQKIIVSGLLDSNA